MRKKGEGEGSSCSSERKSIVKMFVGKSGGVDGENPTEEEKKERGRLARS